MPRSSDQCKFCKSTNLFGGHFDQDGLGAPQPIQGDLDATVTWQVLCQDCGEFQPQGRKRAKAAS